MNKTAGKGYRIVPVVPSFWPFPSEKPLTPDSLTILYVIKEMMQQKLSDILIWGEKKPKTPKRLQKKYIHCEQDIRQRLQNCACGAIILAFSFRKAAYARLTHVLYCHKGDDVTKTFWHFNSRRKENQKEEKEKCGIIGTSFGLSPASSGFSQVS